jgi:deoxyribodipyrimidine photolyase-related protein
MSSSVRNLIFILDDQLSLDISSMKGADRGRDLILMCEVMAEATYVRHHKQKIAYIFSAMRHFAEELRADGYRVLYTCIDDPKNTGSFAGELVRVVEACRPEVVRVTEPGEWRVLQAMKTWSALTGLPLHILPDRRFICSHAEFKQWAECRKSLTMEYFYREMRRKTGLLMDGDEPIGGRWTFDAENRKPTIPDMLRPKHARFAPDDATREIIRLVEELFPGNFGTTAEFGFAVTRDQAEQALRIFMEDFLPSFGETQDAMLQGDPFLNHSLLSFYVNIGFLDPLAVCRAAELEYHQGRAPLNAVEGFIRQIIGWREYMRGIYWMYMPAYAEANFFRTKRPLPSFYWTGETGMNCIKTVVKETIAHAYAHHIQRLMITGNFALLAGVDPRAVHRWYLEVYADAYEWVELPNVIGMSQYADGGLLGTKPYAASGNYISRMSDYCEGCRYDPRQRTGPDACPFNSLYWDFLARNAQKLKGNRRLAQPYATWSRMAEETRREVRRQAAELLRTLS